jgi:hypothetical protein
MQTPAPEIFKAYDIRGIVRTTLTADTVAPDRPWHWAAKPSRGVKAIVIGRDGRLSGPELAGALATASRGRRRRDRHRPGADADDLLRRPSNSAPTVAFPSPAATIRPSTTASRWCWAARRFTAT